MKKFKFLIKLNLLISILLLAIRIFLCVQEGVTIRNSIGVCLYGYVTDFCVLSFFSGFMFVFFSFNIKNRFLKIMSLVSVMLYVFAMNFFILCSIVNVYTWKFQKMSLTLLYFHFFKYMVKIIDSTPNPIFLYVLIILSLLIFIIIDVLIVRKFVKHFWQDYKIKKIKIAYTFLIFLTILSLAKIGANTVAFEPESRQQARNVKKNILLFIYRDYVSRKKALFSFNKKDLILFKEMFGKGRNKLYPLLDDSRTDITKVKKYNVVVIILEQFRAKNVGCLTNLPRKNLTPFFDSIAKKGLLFDNFYANGIQTARGMLATYCSVLPRQENAIFRARKSNSYLSMGVLFKSLGYENILVTGLELYYDNMDRFYTNMQMDKLISKKVMEKGLPSHLFFKWGCHDEAMFLRAAKEAQKAKKPFFMTMMSASNHSPYEYPKTFKTEFSDDKNKLGYYGKYMDGIRYTDYSMSLFFKEAQKYPFHKNTVYLILSDHGEAITTTKNFSSKHRTMIGEDNMRIPFLIYAPGIKLKSRIVSKIGSQIDILPTLAEIMSIKVRNPWIGKSLLNNKAKGMAYLSNPFTQNRIGLRFEDKKIVYRIRDNKTELYQISGSFQEKKIPFEKKHLALRDRLISVMRVNNTLLLENRIYPFHGRYLAPTAQKR